MKKLLFAVAVLLATLRVDRASATSCYQRVEQLSLEIESVEIDGHVIGTNGYVPATLHTDTEGGRELYFVVNGEWNTFGNVYVRGTVVPYEERCPAAPPISGASCASTSGGPFLCGWPDRAPACTARCTSDRWQVAGCP